jgi:hypothetical protein
MPWKETAAAPSTSVRRNSWSALEARWNAALQRVRELERPLRTFDA